MPESNKRQQTLYFCFVENWEASALAPKIARENARAKKKEKMKKMEKRATYLDVTPKLLRYAVQVHGGRRHDDLGGRGDVGGVQDAHELVHL